MKIGEKLIKEFIVLDKHSAKNMGSGDLEVLSTPSLIAFIEETCKDLLAQRLENDSSSVGSHVSLDHLAASKISARIKIEAEIVNIEKERFVYFSANAYDGDKKIGQAKHTRVIVNVEKFLSKL
ncbi:MAG: thioesterase family protein [Gemella sp.]|nr:thioesterase family protein [Gemella sp.]